MTGLQNIYNTIKTRLNNEQEARWIIEERTGLNWSDILADQNISQAQKMHIEEDVQKRLAGEPLSRVYGEREFWGLSFQLSKDTLDPRPETELIVELALQRFSKERPLRILDLGTGSGCILISLLSEFPNATGFGVDVSHGAALQARRNAKANKVDSRIRFVCGSWLEAIDSRFDLIVSNPPYIARSVIPTLSREVRDYDPILALDGGMEGLDPYKIVFLRIKDYFFPGGLGLFEIGYDQEEDVMRLAENAGFALRRVHVDYSGNPRVVEISCGDK